jgi:ribonuclease M5
LYIKEVIVVEGKDDTAAIKRAVQADTIETNGSALNEQTLEQIRHVKEKRGVIIFTDPDYPGTRIRNMIDEAIPGCKHAFLKRSKAISKKGLGVEHAKPSDIIEALQKVYELHYEPKQTFTKKDLLEYGLIGSRRAKERRKKLGEELNIGVHNGKQLERRLNMFQITKETFVRTMEKILQEEE